MIHARRPPAGRPAAADRTRSRRPRVVPRGRGAFPRRRSPRASRRRRPKPRSPRCCASASSVLPIGAQSSLTGGATPRGDVRAQHVAPQSRSSRPATTGSASQAGVTLVDLDAALRADGQALSARADLHRRVRRRHRRHQRRGRGDVQVRDDARLGARADGRARQRRRARRRARTDARASRRLLRDRPVGPHRARAGAALPDAGRAEGLGRLLRGAGHGSDRSVHRIRGHARRDHRGHAARRCRRGRRMCLAFVPFGDRAAALAFVTRLRDAARETWRTRRSARAGRLGHRAHGRALPGAAARGRRRSGQRRRRSPTTRRSRCSSRWSCRRPRRRRARSTRSAAPASRTRPDTPLVRFCRALDEAGVLDRRRDRGARRRRARAAAARAARGRAGRRQRARRPREAASTRASRRPRPT